MESQIAIKPSLNVSIRKNLKTNILASEHVDKEYTTVKFKNSTPLNSLLKRYEYVDFEIPSGFKDITKIDQAVIDLECKVNKVIPESGGFPQTLYASANQINGNNGLNLTPYVTPVSIVLPVSGTYRNNNCPCVFTNGTVNTNGDHIIGPYDIKQVVLSASNPAFNSTAFITLVYQDRVAKTFTPIADSAPITITGTPTAYDFTVNFPKSPFNNEIEYIGFLVNVGNTLFGSGNNITVTFTPGSGPTATRLERNINVGNAQFIQNIPVWGVIDRCQILINGKVADEIASQNFFTELALQDRETLHQYSSTMLFDPETYGLLYKFPGAIILTNPNPVPTNVSRSFSYQIPLFSTFITSENYLTDFIKDKITVRLFLRPHSTFKVSCSDNAADSMEVTSASLYLTGSKYLDEDIDKIRKEKGKDDLVSMILLRKYGSTNLIRVQQADNLTYAPLYGQAIYDLSYINGRYICLFTMLYPENVIGGENYCQLALPTKAASTVTAYDSTKLTVNENLNVYPLDQGVSRSRNNVNGNEYRYTPDSAFALDRVSIIDDLGNPIYQNLQYAPFLRNVMSTTGINNDFLKTYAIYPFYFSNKIHEDYRRQHAENGFISIKNIYNIEIILANPESSSLPFYNGSGQLVNTLQNSLWTCGLMIAELHVKPNGKLVIITS